MDYIDKCKIKTFLNYKKFEEKHKKERIILMTTRGKIKYHKFRFKKNDTILFGRESQGVPESVHKSVDKRLVIPIQEKTRSLNIVSSVAIVLSEALKQNNNI